MAKARKVQKKLDARLRGYQKIIANPNAKESAYTAPGSRNWRKG